MAATLVTFQHIMGRLPIYVYGPGGREMAPSDGEREDAGPGLLTGLVKHTKMRNLWNA